MSRIPLAPLAPLALVGRVVLVGLVALASARPASAQVPLEAASAVVELGTRGVGLPVLLLDVAMPARDKPPLLQPLVGGRFALDTGSIDAHVGLQGRPCRGDTFGLRLAGTAGPQLSVVDGLAAGGRVTAEAQGEIRLGDFVLALGPKLDGLVVVDGGVVPRLSMLGTLAAGWLPPRSFGVVIHAEGGVSVAHRGLGVVGAAYAGVIVPLPGT